MVDQRWIVRMGAAVIVLAIALRLVSGGLFVSAVKLLQKNEIQALFVSLQTGRPVRLPPSQNKPDAAPVEHPSGDESASNSEQTALPVFSQADLEVVDVLYRCDYRPEILPLLTSPLELTLRSEAPTVLIVHTHATESYAKQPGQDYVEDVAYRTRDERYNMVAVGAEIARVLESGGIQVIHDRTLFDYPSYNDSYNLARAAIAQYLEQYPSIQMVLDIHRDAIDGSDGTQLVTYGKVDGQPSAQLMMVVGTDAMGYTHPNWKDNLALALKLTALLEREDPGLTRPVMLREYRFNTDMTPGSLLVEVGGAGDTLEQALLAANALARGILALSQGSK